MCDEIETCGDSLIAQEKDVAMITVLYILIFQDTVLVRWNDDFYLFPVLEMQEQNLLLIQLLFPR